MFVNIKENRYNINKIESYSPLENNKTRLVMDSSKIIEINVPVEEVEKEILKVLKCSI